MNSDPIVDEVRRIREELARRFNYDIHAIFADLRTRQPADDPMHPLVEDARAWEAAREESLTLREEPPERGTKQD